MRTSASIHYCVTAPRSIRSSSVAAPPIREEQRDGDPRSACREDLESLAIYRENSLHCKAGFTTTQRTGRRKAGGGQRVVLLTAAGAPSYSRGLSALLWRCVDDALVRGACIPLCVSLQDTHRGIQAPEAGKSSCCVTGR